MLCRRGLLVAITTKEGRRFARNTGARPPDLKFLDKGPVGFTFYLSTWFRYYLQQYIEQTNGYS